MKKLDGDILTEREIARTSAGSGDGIPTPEDVPLEEQAASGSGGDSGQRVLGPAVPRRSIPNAPPPPRRSGEGVPEDIPDAKDDDIIARQLREAAMQEEDPELKEKLWEEYRKYKKG